MTELNKTRLKTEITALGHDFVGNSEKIFNLEKNLGKILDNELRDKLQDYKVFEVLNAEKASPHFLEICKKAIQGEVLLYICDDLGNSFPTADELNNYVTNFYKSLYRIDDTVQGEIEDFLGPEIVNHPMVRGSILTRDERNLLDSEIKIEELDLSLNQSNLKSSPGMDGFSYSFITKFWHIYRKPLFECAKISLENQSLPESFLTAQIKLIPKKGNSKKIGNWRPISLLSNFYKIIS